MIAATGGLIALVLAPFAEEPWLEEVHGAAYLSYRRRTPRFLGLPRQ
jgi:protein-S-isoprenylcysteine O-methyltransferase Ste14